MWIFLGSRKWTATIVKSLNELSTQSSALGNKRHAGAFINVHSQVNRSAGGVKHCALASMQNYIAVCLFASLIQIRRGAGAHVFFLCANNDDSRPETEVLFFSLSFVMLCVQELPKTLQGHWTTLYFGLFQHLLYYCAIYLAWIGSTLGAV